MIIKELETNFGTFDPEGEAEAKLKQLHMHKNHQAMKYFIKFQQLATHVRHMLQSIFHAISGLSYVQSTHI